MTPEEVTKKLEELQVFIQGGDIKIYHKYLNLLPDESLVLDLGTGWGKSVIAMALCCDSRHFIQSVDNGSYPIVQGWATEDTYLEKLEERVREYGAKRVILYKDDLLEMEVPAIFYDLLHLDIMEDAEAQVLERWLPTLRPGGYGLIRNYKRFKEKADELLKGFEFLDYDGLIQVVRKPE